jgi:LPXTG-motif cell wall-anchored protein
MPCRRIIVAMLALALALPSAAFAQGAGDEQYQDPFGDEQAQNDGSNGNAAQDDGGLSDEPPVQGGNGETETPTTPAPEEPAEDVAPEEAQAPRTLPNTGSDPRALAFFGVLFLLAGVGLRLRTIDPDAF